MKFKSCVCVSIATAVLQCSMHPLCHEHYILSVIGVPTQPFNVYDHAMFSIAMLSSSVC